MQGEKTISDGGVQENLMRSLTEWFVRVNDSCLGNPTAQSLNRTWFSLNARKIDIIYYKNTLTKG